jgi:alanine dehydrogenase
MVGAVLEELSLLRELHLKKELTMTRPKTIGFPRMMKEAGEKRVFLPEFIQFLTNLGAQVFIEEGYGARSGFSFADYQQANPKVEMCSRQEAFQQDVVIILRSPKLAEFELLRPHATLISMLHYPTRPIRVGALKDCDIHAISMDSIENDINVRLVENMKAVAWNGLESAFDVLDKRWPGLIRPDGKPLQVLVLGTGMVGKHAVDAATKFGSVERNADHMEAGGPGGIAQVVGRNISANAEIMRELFSQADVLVDATQRRDTAKPVVPNAWIEWLPEHAVITDLAVDPYTLAATPPVVRGVEGIPQGSLDKYVFDPHDSEWEETVPDSIPSQNRRTVVSCYSWPGIHPEASMRHYGQQLEPLLEVLMEKGYQRLTLEGSYFERALYRGTLKAWLKHPRYVARPR